MSDRILITGGTGFAGSHLVEYLVANTQADIHVTTYSAVKDPILGTAIPEHNVHSLDLSDAQATAKLFEKLQPTQIYHLAALASVGDSFAKAEATTIINTKLQLAVLNALKEVCPSARLMIVGSAQEYDVIHPDFQNNPHPLSELDQLGPANPYGVSKVTQDLLGLSYVYSYDLDIVRVRPFNHIGERQPLGFAVSDFSEQIAQIELGQAQELRVGNLTAIRDFTDVKDVVAAYVTVMNQGKKGEVYNIGSGHGVSLQHVLDQLCALSSVEIPIVPDTTKIRPIDVPETIANNERMRSLGWRASIPLHQTLERVLNYWRQQVSISSVA